MSGSWDVYKSYVEKMARARACVCVCEHTLEVKKNTCNPRKDLTIRLKLGVLDGLGLVFYILKFFFLHKSHKTCSNFKLSNCNFHEYYYALV